MKLGFSFFPSVKDFKATTARGLKAKKHCVPVENITWKKNRKQWDAILNNKCLR